jgi:hypothetical protein
MLFIPYSLNYIPSCTHHSNNRVCIYKKNDKINELHIMLQGFHPLHGMFPIPQLFIFKVFKNLPVP